MIPEELRKVRGGVIGCLTPKEIIIDVKEKPELGAVSDNVVGIKVPAGKFVYAAYVKNLADDLASGGSATVAVKVGATAVLAATGIADIKGKGKAAQAAAPTFVAADTDVKLTVATAALTAGKLAVGVIYG